MGDERREQKVKQQPIGEDPVRAKRNAAVRDEERAVEESDTSHADRQLAMRSNAPGFTDAFGPERAFRDTGADQAKLWPEVEAILDKRGDASTLAAKVADLDREGRDKVGARIADVAKVAPGADVLQIGDLVGLPAAAKLRAAIAARSAPPASALRAHVLMASTGELVTWLDDATRAKLKSLYASPLAVVPQIAAMDLELARSKPLVAWYLESTPATTIALAMMRIPSSSVKPLSTTLNEIGASGWSWVSALTDEMVSSAQMVGQHLEFEPELADVKSSLQARTPKQQKGAAPGGASALLALVPDDRADVAAVIRAAANANTFEKSETYKLGKSPYRERLIAAATLQQLTLFLNHIGIYDAEQLDWLLDSPHATVDAIAEIAASWSYGMIKSTLETPKLLGRLTAKFPAAGPADLFGGQRNAVYDLAQTNKAVRAWCAATADPRELLRLVTFKKATITKLWSLLVSEGVDPKWVQRLGPGNGDDNDLRSLALNCPDPASAAWIRTHVLGDDIEQRHASSKAEAIAPIAHESSAGKRLEQGSSADEISEQELGRRASELSDAEIAQLRANPDQLATMISTLHDEWLTRFLFRARPSLTIVLRHADLVTHELAAYIRSRPNEETADALAEETIAARVRSRVKAPFAMLPALQEARVLAAVLDADMLTWLLENTDKPHAIRMLGQPVAARRTAKVFAKAHLELFPSRIKLAKADADALERIAAAIPASELADRLRGRQFDPDLQEDEEPGEEAIRKPRGVTKQEDAGLEHSELEAALAHTDLASALDIVLKAPPARSNVLAVCRERVTGAHELLTKSEHAERVDRLRRAVRMSPIAVFPGVPWFAYLHTANARRWLFEDEPASEILHELAAEPALARLVFSKIDEDDPALRIWIGKLPKGSTLTPGERTQVREIFDHVKTGRAARKLFEIRFGTRVVGNETFTHDELARVWTLFERVPDAHVAQGSIRNLNEMAAPNLPGMFGGGTMHLVEGLTRGDKLNHEYDQKLELTREQLVAAYGYDEQQLQARIAAQEITVIETEKGQRYRIEKQEVPLLDFTVLHEIGHAVDEMLGQHTELVFGLAGWHQYGESDLDQLGKDLGGWDRVRPADQARIRDAWQVWLNSDPRGGLEKLVGDDHPALAKKYAGVGLVDLGREKQRPGIDSTKPINGHHVLINEQYQQFYRVPDRTRNAAPSHYSMTAPKEFFAECYAEYYWQFKGAGTEDKKGGRLPAWIKSWFDKNIDTLKHNPSRKP